MAIGVEERGDVRIVRVGEAKLTYRVLGGFFAKVQGLVEAGARRVLLDFSAVAYVDSAAIGCLMDIHRLLHDGDGVLGLVGLQPRVETMISMTGVLKLIEAYRDEAEALAALGGGAQAGE
jgi:anti-anti-sigma factor